MSESEVTNVRAEERYTLNEADTILRRKQCRGEGHDLDQTLRLGADPVVYCLRCRRTFTLAEDEGFKA